MTKKTAAAAKVPPVAKKTAKAGPAAKQVAPAPPPPAARSGRYEIVKVSQIVPWVNNPRKKFSQAKITELAADMRAKGVLEPPIVREHALAPGGFLLVAGERRWRAATMAGLEDIGVLVRELTDEEAYDIALAENIQRADLSALEESDAFQYQITTYGYSVEEITHRVGLSKAHVYQRLSLQYLSPPVRTLFEGDKFGVSIAIELSRIHNHALQERAAGALINAKVNNLVEARTFIRTRYVLALATAKFDVDDKHLVEAAGACASCPKNTAMQVQMFPDDDKAAGYCLDEACWATKCDAHWREVREEAAAKGQRVIEGPEAAKHLLHGHLRHEGSLQDLSAAMYVGNAPIEVSKAIAPHVKKHPEVVIHLRGDDGTMFQAVDKKVFERIKKELNLFPKKPPAQQQAETKEEAAARKAGFLAEAVTETLQREIAKKLRTGKPLEGQRNIWTATQWLLLRVIHEVGMSTEVVDRFELAGKEEVSLHKVADMKPHTLIMILLEAAVAALFTRTSKTVDQDLIKLAEILDIDYASIELAQKQELEAAAVRGAAERKKKTPGEEDPADVDQEAPEEPGE